MATPNPDPAGDARALYLTGGVAIFAGFLGFTLIGGVLPMFDAFVLQVTIATLVASGVFLGIIMAAGGLVIGLVSLIFALRASAEARRAARAEPVQQQP